MAGSGLIGPPGVGAAAAVPTTPPPLWPPVAPGGDGRDALPGIPPRLSASLDMTSELPRMRGEAPPPSDHDGWSPGGAASSTSFADDMTMELPIFRELESAWFHPHGMGDGAMAGGSGGAGSEEVSWRFSADEGWLAAQAAADPSDGGLTDTGLPRRVPMAQLVPGGVDDGSGAGADRRSPDSVRGLLSAYHQGVQMGRSGRSHDSEPSTGWQTSGKEPEA
jgi:hypothetical protein